MICKVKIHQRSISTMSGKDRSGMPLLVFLTYLTPDSGLASLDLDIMHDHRVLPRVSHRERNTLAATNPTRQKISNLFRRCGALFSPRAGSSRGDLLSAKWVSELLSCIWVRTKHGLPR